MAGRKSDVFIVGACRTAIGELGGALAGLGAVELAATAMREAVGRSKMPPGEVEETFLGNVLSAGLGMSPARQAALAAGLPVESPALDVGMVCGSGLRAVALAADAIRLGRRSVALAGGAESMSNAPHFARGLRSGKKLGGLELEDSLIADGLTCSVGREHMGLTAERLAEELGIPRREQDEFALRSHRRAVAARAEFEREIVCVRVPQRKGPPLELKADERPRADTSLEKLAALKPAFREGGTVTAGNASGVSDGAAALVLASGEVVEKNGLSPFARLLDWDAAGVAPARMGMGPVPATRGLCGRLGIEPADFDLVELNEAFAAQAIAVVRELKLDIERVNVRGGAVALGHPLGCSGVRILVTLIHAMRDRGAKKGLAALCIGTGMGIAMAVEAM